MHEGQNLDTHKIWERGGLGVTPGGMWVLPGVLAEAHRETLEWLFELTIRIKLFLTIVNYLTLKLYLLHSKKGVYF